MLLPQELLDDTKTGIIILFNHFINTNKHTLWLVDLLLNDLSNWKTKIEILGGRKAFKADGKV